jgi:hypothetical protein
MGDNVRNDIQWRKQWVDRLTETEQFFDNFNKMESMPYTLFYSKDITQGKINYQNETVALSIETYLYGSSIWTVSIERALQAVYDGLNATKRKDVWELGRWPQQGVTNLKAFERRGNNFSVVFELVNNQNKVIGRQALQAGGSWGLNWSGRPRVEISNADRKTLNFQNVKANDITDNLTIRVANVNGTDAETAAINGVLQIRAITKSEVNIYDSFSFSRGEVRGFANIHAKNPKDLVIPDAIWGDPVLSIGKEAFKNAGLTSVVIPHSVASIGEEAFSGNLSRLRSITIGADMDISLSSFDYNIFQDCYNRNGKKAGTYIYTYTDGRRWISESEMEQGLKRDRRLIRLGARYRGVFFGQDPNAGSELFGKSYASYEEMEKAKRGTRNQFGNGYYLNPGLTLGLRITDNIFLATELNYNYVFDYNFWYGDEEKGKDEYFAEVTIDYQTIEIPVLLRRWSNYGGAASVYIEAGFQVGFPISSKATLSSGSSSPIPFKDEFSDFRVKKDYGPVFGFGIGGGDFSMGVRITYPLTKLDRYGTVNAPAIGSFTIAYDFI